MDRQIYLHELRRELQNLQIEDIDEIVAEYGQHIAFKTADGEREEEIISAMPDPRQLAAEFAEASEKENAEKPAASVSVLTKTVLYFSVALFSIPSVALLIVLAAIALAFGILGVCLIGQIEIALFIPPMPYAGAALMGLTMLALTITFATITVMSGRLLRQFFIAFGRRYSRLRANGNLAQLPWLPKISWRTKVVFRWSVLASLILAIITYAVLASQARALGFWHVWNWFV